MEASARAWFGRFRDVLMSTPLGQDIVVPGIPEDIDKYIREHYDELCRGWRDERAEDMAKFYWAEAALSMRLKAETETETEAPKTEAETKEMKKPIRVEGQAVTIAGFGEYLQLYVPMCALGSSEEIERCTVKGRSGRWLAAEVSLTM